MDHQPRRRRRLRAPRGVAALLVGIVVACAAACGGSSDGDAVRSAAASASEGLPDGMRQPSSYQLQRAREIVLEEQAKDVPDDLAMRAYTATTLAMEACPLVAAGINVGATTPQEMLWDGNALAREVVEDYPLARNIGALSLHAGVATVGDFYDLYARSKVDGGCVTVQESAIEALDSNWMRMRLLEEGMADWPESITTNASRNEALFLVLAERRVPPDRSGFPTPEPASSPTGAVRAFLDAPPREVIYAFEWSRILQGYEFGPVQTDGHGNARVCIAAMKMYPMTPHAPEAGYVTYGFYLTEEPDGWVVSEVTGGNFGWPMENRPSPAPSSLWDHMGDLDCPLRPS